MAETCCSEYRILKHLKIPFCLVGSCNAVRYFEHAANQAVSEHAAGPSMSDFLNMEVGDTHLKLINVAWN